VEKLLKLTNILLDFVKTENAAAFHVLFAKRKRVKFLIERTKEHAFQL